MGRDKILDIFKKYQPEGYTHDFIHCSFFNDIADEITSLPFYEKEFTEWLMTSEYFKGKLSEGYLTPVFGLPQADSLDELYEYWTKNVKQ